MHKRVTSTAQPYNKTVLYRLWLHKHWQQQPWFLH